MQMLGVNKNPLNQILGGELTFLLKMDSRFENIKNHKGKNLYREYSSMNLLRVTLKYSRNDESFRKYFVLLTRFLLYFYSLSYSFLNPNFYNIKRNCSTSKYSIKMLLMKFQMLFPLPKKPIFSCFFFKHLPSNCQHCL